jgi:diadenosine tetraphosphate (Ap4A) HIT family hydrolase
MLNECLICTRIEQIRRNSNPYYVAELNTGYVVLGDFQFFHGYTLFLCKHHLPELHQLDHTFRMKFLEEMSAVAHAVFEAFKPRKLNYELLGNSEAHLHWHLFPRHVNDPVPGSPVWIVDKSIRYADSARPGAEQLHEQKLKLLEQLNITSTRFIIHRYADDISSESEPLSKLSSPQLLKP